ncbi:MAG: transglycosylase domain-containing protein [Rhodospirillales bacterium]
MSHDGMWRLRTRPQDVAPAYLDLLLRMEDRRFYFHPGIDPLAMLRAIAQLATHGRIVSGGSTITMQVARLLHPHRHDFVGKLRDMWVALQLEARLSKSEILSLYLTLAPFGGNIEGVRAASLIYFGHDPSTLSSQEAALLVALPQSPSRRRPDRHPFAAPGRDPPHPRPCRLRTGGLDAGRSSPPTSRRSAPRRPLAPSRPPRPHAQHAGCHLATIARIPGAARNRLVRRRRRNGRPGGPQPRPRGAGLPRRQQLFRPVRHD